MANYLEKVKQIAEATAIADKKLGDNSMTDFLSEQLAKFPAYYQSVIMMETQMTILNAQLDASGRDKDSIRDYQAKVKNIDTTRKIKHDAAVDSIHSLNRLCTNILHLEPFFESDELNTAGKENIISSYAERHAVAKFVGEYCNQIYHLGINEPYDTYTAQLSADPKQSSEELVKQFTNPALSDADTKETIKTFLAAERKKREGLTESSAMPHPAPPDSSKGHDEQCQIV